MSLALVVQNDGTADTSTSTGSHTAGIGNYRVVLHAPGERRTARVEGFDRSRGGIALLREALDALERPVRVARAVSGQETT